MQVNQFSDASLFYARAKDYLLTHEAHHCLLLQITHTLIHQPQRYDSQPYLATVETQGKIVAVAMRTPPRRLLLSKIEDFGAVEAIAQDLYLNQPQLPGVSSLFAEAQAFNQVWEKITGQSGKMGKQKRIHQIQQVQPIPFAPGYLRLAQQSDRDLMLDWFSAFAIAVNPNGTSQECSSCGHKVKKPLSQRMHNCPVCHASLCRDLNAAINIKKRGAHAQKAQSMSPKGSH